MDTEFQASHNVSLYLERAYQSVSALSTPADLGRGAIAARMGIATLTSSCVSTEMK